MTEAPPAPPDALRQWVDNQRALARALGLTIEEWLDAIDGAGSRTTGLTAAVVGAAMARGLGLSVLDGLDGAKLSARARALIDPRPPRVTSPLLKEAVRRAEDLSLSTGAGARRLRTRVRRDPLPTPSREVQPLGSSADLGTPDAPGSRPPPLETGSESSDE